MDAGQFRWKLAIGKTPLQGLAIQPFSGDWGSGLSERGDREGAWLAYPTTPTIVGDVVDLHLIVEDAPADSKQFCSIFLDPVSHF